MNRICTLATLLFMPGAALAGDLSVSDPFVPLAPPGVMAHAAYFTLTNTGSSARQLVGVNAKGYAMAHIHRSEVTDGVAAMSSVDEVTISPGQTVTFSHGGLHVMLMHPSVPLVQGDTIALSLQFANGETLTVSADIRRRDHGS